MIHGIKTYGLILFGIVISAVFILVMVVLACFSSAIDQIVDGLDWTLNLILYLCGLSAEDVTDSESQKEE